MKCNAECYFPPALQTRLVPGLLRLDRQKLFHDNHRMATKSLVVGGKLSEDFVASGTEFT